MWDSGPQLGSFVLNEQKIVQLVIQENLWSFPKIEIRKKFNNLSVVFGSSKNDFIVESKNSAVTA